MGISVLILGRSGTGKSTSMRNFKPDEIALVNVIGKPLPFRSGFTEVYSGDNYARIKEFIKQTDKKIVVIDDVQYLLVNEFMRNALEKGYEKFTIMAKNFNDLLVTIRDDLEDDKIVYLLGHTEMDQDGFEKFKTMGKLLDNNVNVEGTCSVVLKTVVQDQAYGFQTQNNGKDTCKSPLGMFNAYVIDNDLSFVDESIRNYWGVKGALSDDELSKKKSAHVIQDDAGKKPKRRKVRTQEPLSKAVSGEDDLLDINSDELPW